MTGAIVQSFSIQNNNTIDLSFVNDGIYMISLKNKERESIRQKIIIQK